MTDRNFELLDEMDAIAKDLNALLSQVALAWLLADPVITSPIIGATSTAQLDENLGALLLQLTPEQHQRLKDLTAWDQA